MASKGTTSGHGIFHRYSRPLVGWLRSTGVPTEIIKGNFRISVTGLLALPFPASTLLTMGDLTPVAYDIETSGLSETDVITVAGLAFELGEWLVLNTGGRDADADRLAADLETRSGSTVQVRVVADEAALLAALNDCVADRMDADRHYVCAHNGEVWGGGFDMPVTRTACVRCECEWPFGEFAYSDTMDMVDRFDTGDSNDLVSAHEMLIGDAHCDPFDDSESAVAAFEREDWTDLLAHNLADIRRTRDLALLAEQFVPKSDFNMKSLAPPG